MKYIILIIISLIVGFLIGFKIKKPEYVTTTETEYVFDTIPEIIKEPYEVVIRDTIKIEVTPQVDTVFIIKDYFTKYTEFRKWEDDDIRIELTDTVFNNKVFTGNLKYSILRPTEINTTTVQYNNKYVTLEGLLPLQDPKNYGIRISYVNKNVYSLSFRPEEKIVEIGYGWTIKKW